MNEKTSLDRKVDSKLLVAVGLIALVAGIGLSQNLSRFSTGDSLQFFGDNKATAAQTSLDFVTLAKRLAPAVVNVSATPTRKNSRSSPRSEEAPRGEFFGMPPPPESSQQLSVGSGFVIGNGGLILTNQHLIEGDKKITVKLSDGKEFAAKVVGQDSRTDIAIIKIDDKSDLPSASLGNSNRLEVGEWVLAIGNPFGLDNSVTSGIVSAKGRHIGAGPYDDFIQTDAPINPGNSGGPLVNLRGEVIGINTAVVSQTGGNTGIGFAIPIDLIKELLPQLIEKGKVIRGWLGVSIQGLTPEIAKSLGVNRTEGALVADVTKDGPAHHGGIQQADIITEFDGHQIKDAKDLPLIVARAPLNKRTQIKILRDNKQLTLNVTIGELPESGATKRQQELG